MEPTESAGLVRSGSPGASRKAVPAASKFGLKTVTMSTATGRVSIIRAARQVGTPYIFNSVNFRNSAINSFWHSRGVSHPRRVTHSPGLELRTRGNELAVVRGSGSPRVAISSKLWGSVRAWGSTSMPDPPRQPKLTGRVANIRWEVGHLRLARSRAVRACTNMPSVVGILLPKRWRLSR